MPDELVRARPTVGASVAVGWIAAHGVLGSACAAAWAGVCWGLRQAGFPRPFDGRLVWCVPGLVLVAGIALLARRHRRVGVAIFGSVLGAVCLVTAQVGLVRSIDGPIEEIGTGGLLILALLMLAVPEGIVGASIGGVVAWRAGRGERRRLHGCCMGCGYSLRGLVSGLCPECGRAV